MATVARWRYLTVIALGYLVSLATFSRLPGFGPGGNPLSARLEVASVLPTAAAVIYAAVHRVWARDSVRDSDGAFEPTYGAIVFAVVLFLIAIHVMVVTSLAGIVTGRGWQARATIVLFGLLMVRIGDLLPRTRPNLALGIRTPGTLSDRRLWMQIHRAAGYLAVGLGALFVVSGAFFSKSFIESVLGSAVLGAAVALVLSHCTYSLRRQRS
jgi:hypothetical protein